MNFNKKTIIAAAGNVAPAGWELDNAVLPNYLSVISQSTNTYGMYFSPNGLNLYITSDSVIHQYVLSTSWQVSTATYTRSLSYPELTPTGVHFSPDGTKMFAVNTGGIVRRYSLGTAWNISSTTSSDESVNSNSSNCQDIFFSTDGTKMFAVSLAPTVGIMEFNLSSAWSLGSITLIRTFTVSAQETSPAAMYFKSDGLTMFVIGSAGDDINEYSLSTAWDLSTATFVRQSGVIPEGNPTGLFFKPDGTVVYVVGTVLDTIYTYIATTPWNVSTLKTKNLYRVATQEITPNALHFSTDGTKMYVMGSTGDDINQYNLTTPWDIQTATYEKIFSVAVEETGPNSLFFSPDGTNMYVTGTSGDDVNQYSLSTAWDVGTASYVRVFSVASQEASPTGLYFSPDGTRMYVTGTTGDDINQYDLLVPWNVGTAVYVRVSASGLDATPSGIFFKPDGTRFYLYGFNSDILWAYNLTTPWNLSTLVYYQQLSLKNLDEQIQDIYFKPDGTMLYAVGASLDAVYAIELN